MGSAILFFLTRMDFWIVAVISYFCGCFNGAVIVSKYILRTTCETTERQRGADQFLPYLRRPIDLCGYSHRCAKGSGGHSDRG